MSKCQFFRCDRPVLKDGYVHCNDHDNSEDMGTYQFKPGDIVQWDDGTPGTMVVDLHDDYDRVHWKEDGKWCMTRATNLQLVRRADDE